MIVDDETVPGIWSEWILIEFRHCFTAAEEFRCILLKIREWKIRITLTLSIESKSLRRIILLP